MGAFRRRLGGFLGAGVALEGFHTVKVGEAQATALHPGLHVRNLLVRQQRIPPLEQPTAHVAAVSRDV